MSNQSLFIGGAIEGIEGIKWAFDSSLGHSDSQTLIAEQWIEVPQLSTESTVSENRTVLCGFCDREYASTEDLPPDVIEGGSVTPSSLSKSTR